MPSVQLEQLLRRAQRVVCRSGYSSVMDFAALHKRALYIPTTGQTEQEYLAAYFSKSGHALYTVEGATNLLAKLNQLDMIFPLKLENNRLDYLVNLALKELK